METILRLVRRLGRSGSPTTDPSPLTDVEVSQLRGMLEEFYPPEQNLGLPSLHHIEDTVKHWAEDDLRPEIDAAKTAASQAKSVADHVVADFEDLVLKDMDYVMREFADAFIKSLKPMVQKLFDLLVNDIPQPQSLYIKIGWVAFEWDDTSALVLESFPLDLADVLTSGSDYDLISLVKQLKPTTVTFDPEVAVPVVDVGLELQLTWDADTFIEKVWGELKPLVA